MWKTILVAHDFSECAAHALEVATHEARAHGARIVLLHVVELLPKFGHDTSVMVRPGTTQPISVRRYYMETAETELAPIVAGLRAEGIEVSIEVRSGVPIEELSAAVADHAADVIVMGTHGRTGLHRWIAGSVAERMVRSSTVPVLTIRHPDSEVPSRG